MCVIQSKKRVSVLDEFKSFGIMKVILEHNTSTNIGCESGLITNLCTNVCFLHRKEFPFNVVFKHIDGIEKSLTNL